MSALTHHQDGFDPQIPFDVSVVMPTLLRPGLLKAGRSVFSQINVSRIQLLIGIDRADGDRAILDRLRDECPNHCAVTVLDLGYSTAEINGGIHPTNDGGSLRSLLTFAANSRYVAYLDDDNWWAEDHLPSLLKVIQGKTWAYTDRWFVNPETEQPICIDEWESTGPDKGIYNVAFGGFVDPNCLMIDKLACLDAIHQWCMPFSHSKSGKLGADRNVFKALRERGGGAATGRASVYYVLSAVDADGRKRIARLKEIEAEQAQNG